MTSSSREHHVYEWSTLTFKYKVPYLPDDPNHGLPLEFFESDNLIDFEIEGDVIEWWPAMGPAPHWSALRSSFKNDQEMFEAFKKWCRET